MRILILGSGLMGPAAAFNVMSDPDVEQVIVCDRDGAALDGCAARLKDKPGAGKLETLQIDLGDEKGTIELLQDGDAAIAALPRSLSLQACRVAISAGTPLVDLSRPEHIHLPALHGEAKRAGVLIVLGCGVEPGLTEIMARYLAEKLDRVDELHIKCGGIPEEPAPPLGYKIVFGGRRLPLTEKDAVMVQNGNLIPVPRYSGVEEVIFPNVGQCEAWHEGFMPWLLELPALQDLTVGTQKTVRWPGYAAKVSVLKEIGLLSLEPVDVEGTGVIPKHLVDALLYPHVRLRENERDMTLLRVEAIGEKDGRRRHHRIDMIDRYDDEGGFTSMARTTAFTGAIVARMIARGEIRATGALPPEQILSGPLFDQLVAELAAAQIVFELAEERELGTGGLPR
jgi:lysine 6-dehydrogenase